MRALKHLLFLMALALLLSACSSMRGISFIEDKIDVTIKIQDESGKPIPYVTVWQYVMPDLKHVDSIVAYPDMNDLWRVATRYKNTAEHVVRYGEQLIYHFHVLEMGNNDGIARTTLNYKELMGKRNNYKRPDPMNFGFTFIKHGYLSGKVEFNLPRSDDKVEATVVLKRDPNQEIETAPYIQEFERLRYLLSDTTKDFELGQNNRPRTVELEKALEAAAQQAIAAGDKKAAARIYIRMRYLPDVVLSDRVVSYGHVNRESKRSKRVWALAQELDPDNLFIQMFSIYDGYGDEFHDLTTSKEELYQRKLDAIEKVIQKHELAVWPKLYVWRANLYLRLNQPEKARLLYDEIMNIEPKYYDWGALLEYKRFKKKKNP